MSTIETPDSMLARHPETAYFWGFVAGSGRVTDDGIELKASDETAARRLAAVAGGAEVDHRIRERAFAHDTSVTRAEDEYTLRVVAPDVAEGASASFGLPVDGGAGGYRFDAFRDHYRQLLRGLVEACGVVCFRESAGEVGVSFVHDDRRLLERTVRLLDAEGFDADPIQESSSGGYWFGVADEDTAAFARYVYEGSDDSGLFSPSRRRKALRSVERAASVRAAGDAESNADGADGGGETA